MSRRRGSLFPRRIDEVVKAATRPMMDKQGKLYGALLRDWPAIVGAERAAQTRPQRLQWPTKEQSGAVLHLEASAAVAPELAYESAQIIEQCARYFGYRAIERIVVHASHAIAAKPAAPPVTPREAEPSTMAEILQRMRNRIVGDDKRN